MGFNEDYQNIFHWAETQKDGSIPSFKTRKNDPYKVDMCFYTIYTRRLTVFSTNPDLETRELNLTLPTHRGTLTYILPFIPTDLNLKPFLAQFHMAKTTPVRYDSGCMRNK